MKHSPITTRFTKTQSRGLASASASGAPFALGGCASNPSNAQTGTGFGAVAGGVVGDAVIGSTLGTIGGAAAGALIGNEVGKNSDRNTRNRNRR